MALVALFSELSWLITLLGILIVIFAIAMCVCSREAEISPGYGLEGRLSMTRDSPVLHHHTMNGDAVALRLAEYDSFPEDSAVKRNSWTVKDRALPDIPDSRISVITTASLPLPANGPESILIEDRNHKRKSHNKPVAPKPPTLQITKPETKEGVCEGPSSTRATLKEKPTDKSIISNKGQGLGARPKTQLSLSIPDPSNTSVVLKKIENTLDANESYRRFSDSDTYDVVTNPYAEPQEKKSTSSPVCVRIGIPHQVSDRTSPVTAAGLAVAGAIPSSEIPYMTPPLIHNQSIADVNESPQRRSNGRTELPYTVISVREPLARVREMTIRKQQRTVHQNSEESENHYAMVPEEEQMYAEIGSGQDSGSSSITYAHIEPRELPPVPPTVESLKSVAHAHSRQASSVSNSSFGSCVSVSGESNSPPTLRNPMTALYSTVEKNLKQRKTIHVAEGASILSNIEKHKKIEELYAKVRKKRVELTVNSGSSADYSGYQGIMGEEMDCITPPPSPWASTTPPAPPPITGRLHAASLCVLAPGNGQHIRRHSADPNVPEHTKEELQNENNVHFSYSSTGKEAAEPGYEQIFNDEIGDDACYEKIKDEVFIENECQPSWFESSHTKDRHGNGVHFQGYESVKDLDKDSSDPGYECVAQEIGENNLSDPGYEPVRMPSNFEDLNSNHGYTSLNSELESDPNYETVTKLHSTSSDIADPGYERVKQFHRNDSDATDPGYERVRNQMMEESDPGYETVQRADSDVEPGYETVRLCNEKGSNKSNGPFPMSKSSNEGNSSVSCSGPSTTVLHIPSYTDPNANHDRFSSSLLKNIEFEGTATFL